MKYEAGSDGGTLCVDGEVAVRRCRSLLSIVDGAVGGVCHRPHTHAEHRETGIALAAYQRIVERHDGELARRDSARTFTILPSAPRRGGT